MRNENVKKYDTIVKDGQTFYLYSEEEHEEVQTVLIRDKKVQAILGIGDS